MNRDPKVRRSITYNRSGEMGGGDETSFSGFERNHLFLNREGAEFTDISAISGIDHPADGRAVAILDLDRDGWLDFAIANANAPLLLLYRNVIGNRRQLPVAEGRLVAVKLVGGNQSASATPEWTSRDGIGAKVTLVAGDGIWHRELRAGEGFAAQNSSLLYFGIGEQSQVDRMIVSWPSGRSQEFAGMPAGSLVTVYEDPAAAPGESAAVVSVYARAPRDSFAADRGSSNTVSPRLELLSADADPSTLRLFTAMSPTCAHCVKELAGLRRMRARFTETQLAMFGVPMDESDVGAQLADFQSRHDPPYRILSQTGWHHRARMATILRGELRRVGFPATIVTDRTGTVLATMWGIPTVSDIHRLLATVGLESAGQPAAATTVVPPPAGGARGEGP